MFFNNGVLAWSPHSKKVLGAIGGRHVGTMQTQESAWFPSGILASS